MLSIKFAKEEILSKLSTKERDLQDKIEKERRKHEQEINLLKQKIAEVSGFCMATKTNVVEGEKEWKT